MATDPKTVEKLEAGCMRTLKGCGMGCGAIGVSALIATILVVSSVARSVKNTIERFDGNLPDIESADTNELEQQLCELKYQAAGTGKEFKNSLEVFGAWLIESKALTEAEWENSTDEEKEALLTQHLIQRTERDQQQSDKISTIEQIEKWQQDNCR